VESPAWASIFNCELKSVEFALFDWSLKSVEFKVICACVSLIL
jgi:hypothetical protein